MPFYVTSAEDITQVIPNLTAHDAGARAIALRGQAFAHTHLHLDARMCYWRRLLHGWRKRLAYAPTLAGRPHARPTDGHYTCGECRRPPNPDLIGPWTHGPCASAAAHAGTPREVAPSAGGVSGEAAVGTSGAGLSVRRCQRGALLAGQSG